MDEIGGNNKYWAAIEKANNAACDEWFFNKIMSTPPSINYMVMTQHTPKITAADIEEAHKRILYEDTK